MGEQELSVDRVGRLLCSRADRAGRRAGRTGQAGRAGLCLSLVR